MTSEQKLLIFGVEHSGRWLTTGYVADLPPVTTGAKLVFRGPFDLPGAPKTQYDSLLPAGAASMPVFSSNRNEILWARILKTSWGIWHIGPHLEVATTDDTKIEAYSAFLPTIATDKDVITFCYTSYDPRGFAKQGSQPAILDLVQKVGETKEYKKAWAYKNPPPGLEKGEYWQQTTLYKDELDPSVEYVYNVKTKISQDRTFWLDTIKQQYFKDLSVNTDIIWQQWSVRTNLRVLNRLVPVMTHNVTTKEHNLYFFTFEKPGWSSTDDFIRFSYIKLRKDGSVQSSKAEVTSNDAQFGFPIGNGTDARNLRVFTYANRDTEETMVLVIWESKDRGYGRIAKVDANGLLPNDRDLWYPVRFEGVDPAVKNDTLHGLIVGSTFVEGL